MGHLFVAFGVDIVEDGVEFREVALDVGDFEVVESDFLFFEEDAEFWVLKDELGDGSHGVEFFDESQGCDGGGAEFMGFKWELMGFVDDEEVFFAKEGLRGVGFFHGEVLEDEVVGSDEDVDDVHLFASFIEGALIVEVAS